MESFSKVPALRKSLTGNDESVDGDAVVLVLLVGVGAPQAKPGEESPEEVEEKADNHQGSSATDISCSTVQYSTVWYSMVQHSSTVQYREAVNENVSSCYCMKLPLT